MNTTTYSKAKNVTLLIIRIITGIIFILTGAMKISDMGMTLSYFDSYHLPVVVAYLIAYGELGLGLLLLIGLWPRLVAGILGIIMLGAIYYSIPLGFPVLLLPIILFILLIAVMKCGAGKYAITSTKFN